MKKKLQAISEAFLKFKNSLAAGADEAAKTALLDALAKAIQELGADDTKEYTAEDITKMVTDAIAGSQTIKNAISRDEAVKLENKLTEMIKGSITVKPEENSYLKSMQAVEDYHTVIKNAQNKDSILTSWNKILREKGVIKNDIDPSGVMLPQPIIQSIIDGIQTYGEVWNMVRKTGLKALRIGVNMLDPNANTSRAKRHKKGETKATQTWNLQPKDLDTDVISKLLTVDYQTVAKNENSQMLLKYISEELVRAWVNEVELCILVGDGRDPITESAIKITKFESIARGTSNAFVTVINAADDEFCTMDEARSAVDSVKSKVNKIGVCSTLQLTKLARFVSAAGGDPQFRSAEEVAAQLGLKKIVINEEVNGDNGSLFIVLDTDAYGVVGDKSSENLYQYDIKMNQHNYEIVSLNGGGLMRMYSGATILPNGFSPSGF